MPKKEDMLTQRPGGASSRGEGVIFLLGFEPRRKKLEGWGVYFPQDEKGNDSTFSYHG
jgi:hypothetical protein